MLNVFGQDKPGYIQYNKLIEVKGTGYVIASVENHGKLFSIKGEHLLFINTKTGQSRQTDFPADAQINRVELIKTDSLDATMVLVVAKTASTNGNKTISWSDPNQVFLFAPDGQRLAQLTENGFFASTWIVNKLTGAIVVTGHYDTNKNGEYDKTDKHEVLIFDLKSYKLIAKI